MKQTMRVPRALFDWLTPPRSIAIIVVVGGAFVYDAQWQFRHGGLDAMVGVFAIGPLVGLVVAAPVMALVMSFFGWTHERTWAPWNGIYHAFDDRQIRVTEARDQLWFCSDDVHAALGQPVREGLLKRLRVTEARQDEALDWVLSSAGLVAVFGRSTDRRVLRLLAWAERDVCRPWQNRRDGVKVVADALRAPGVRHASHPAPEPPVVDRLR